MKINLSSLVVFLLFFNITTTMNTWAVGRMSLWILLILSCYILVKKFQMPAVFLFAIVVLSNLFSELLPEVRTIYQVSLAVMFFLTGLVCYGDKPQKLRTLLVVYLFINIPFLLMQITGATPLVMTWGTDYLHTASILSIEEVGTFPKIPVYPTFLVPRDEIVFMIGQSRPAGLMAANNVLSVIVCFSLFLNLQLRRKSVLNVGDLVVNFVAVLVMSKLVFVTIFIVYVLGLMDEKSFIRKASVKNLAVFFCFIGMYYLFFPGLFLNLFSISSFAASFGMRLIDVFASLNIAHWSNFFFFASDEYGLMNLTFGSDQELGHVSGLARTISSPFIIPILIFIVLFLIKFRKKLLLINSSNYVGARFYKILLLLIVLIYSVIAMMFQSILFCFIMGIVLKPFFIKRQNITGVESVKI
ncbi:hypothetical protein OAB62_05525 [Pseudomonadales bacterium]|nr:hypothetical protein [Pseudomonadales bacterium]